MVVGPNSSDRQRECKFPVQTARPTRLWALLPEVDARSQTGAERLDRLLKPFAEADPGFVLDRLTGSGDVGERVADVARAFLFVTWGPVAARDRAYRLGEVDQLGGLTRTDVQHAPSTSGTGRAGCQIGTNHVIDMDKIT